MLDKTLKILFLPWYCSWLELDFEADDCTDALHCWTLSNVKLLEHVTNKPTLYKRSYSIYDNIYLAFYIYANPLDIELAVAIVYAKKLDTAMKHSNQYRS